MTSCDIPGCGGDAAHVRGALVVCAEHESSMYEASEPAPGAKGADFARELVFIKWVDSDDYYGAETAWVSGCPDGAEPRSEENPHTYTWEETVESDWGEREREQWYIVGARDPGRYWIGIDLDVSDDHEESIDFRPDELDVPTHGCLLALSKSGGPHAYVLSDEEPPALTTSFEGIDLLSDAKGVRQAGAVSPWHDDRRGVMTDPEPRDKSHMLVRDEDKLEGLFSVTARGAILEPDTGPRDVDPDDLDLPDAPPGEAPYCVSQLAEVRSSELRYEYGDSPFEADSHLGMLLLANGYSVDEATAFLREHPPYKDTGFDEAETRRQLEYLQPKLADGELTPPVSALTRNGIPASECDCAVHGEDAAEALALPKALSDREASRIDHRNLQRARQHVREHLSSELEGATIYHAPQGLGKTKWTPSGAGDQPRLVITKNKGEHRDTLKWAAERAGVSYAEVIPFSESWLCSDASPVAEECMELYRANVRPKFIIAEYKDVMPEDAECRYIEQFDGDPPDVDLLMGSPGHENVPRFRKMGVPGDSDPVDRAIVYDDVNPADHDITQNTFKLDAARAELNELLQEVPDVPADSVSQLLGNSDAIDAVERIAVGDDPDHDGPMPGETDNVWEELEARAALDDAIRIDIVDIVRRRENVGGDTVLKLKVVAGAEMRGMEPVSWTQDGDRYYSWVANPDLRNHDVTVLSATHVPHVTERWLEETGAGTPQHVSATDNWKSVRRAQGYLLVQTSDSRNSRSGAGSKFYDDDYRDTLKESRDALADAIKRAEGEEPGVIDALALLEGDGINFARVWSNNEYKDKRVGLVAGATYFGDEWVEARAAYCGHQIEIEHEPGELADCESDVGSDLLDYMVQAWVEQAATRFGREDGVDPVVYLNTREVPEGFPAIDVSDRIVELSDTQMAAHEAVAEGAEAIEEIASQLEVGRRQTGNVLWELDEMGLVKIERRALARGRHRVEVSGNRGISLNKIELPDVGRPAAGRIPGADGSSNDPGPDREKHIEDTLDTYGLAAAETDGRTIGGAEETRDRPDTRQTRLE